MVVAMLVRNFLIVALTSLAAMGAHAWEPTTADTQPEDMLGQPSYAETLVTITPVPMPASVIELAHYSPQSTGLRQAKKAKAAKMVQVKSMLSRSAREQIALANTGAKPDERARLTASDDEEDDSGLEDLDLHRSFSQPKVAKAPDQADDDDKAVIDLPDHIRLRLLMARTKAVEAHILSQVGSKAAEQELSDTVKTRLSMARARAVKAHSEKFGVSEA